MEITLTNKQDVEATVAVTVPAKDVDAAFDRILADYGRRIKVPGFRPGKAPTSMIVGRVGEEALTQDVREALIERAYQRRSKRMN
jgi:trigger factor